MPELFNFTQHLKKVVGGALKVHGFKTKGTSFSRENETFLETIEFQRMRHHDENEWGFYINLLVKYKSSKGGASNFRLEYPTKLTIPDYYKEYLCLPVEHSKKLSDYFSDDQIKKILDFNKSIEWYYHSEDELLTILQTAADSLTTRGFHYFQGTEELLEMHLPWREYEKERRKLIKEINTAWE